MSNIVIYNSEGRILRSVSAPPDMLQIQIQEGELGVEGITNLETDYVLSGVITQRPTQATLLDKTTLTANGIDVIHITGAPDGIFTATNVVTGEMVSGSISGSDTFSTTVKGTIKIKIEAFPYLDFEATVEVI